MQDILTRTAGKRQNCWEKPSYWDTCHTVVTRLKYATCDVLEIEMVMT